MKQQYKKKPVVIDAVKFEYTETCLLYLKDWMGNSFGTYRKDRHVKAIGELEIKTLEDGDSIQVAHVASEGDYIIRGVAGEFYPCKPDIFLATYDPV